MVKRLDSFINVNNATTKEQINPLQEMRVAELRSVYSTRDEVLKDFENALLQFTEPNLLADFSESPKIEDIELAFGGFIGLEIIEKTLGRIGEGIDKTQSSQKELNKISARYLHKIFCHDTLLDLVSFCAMCISGEVGEFKGFTFSGADISKAFKKYKDKKNEARNALNCSQNAQKAFEENRAFMERWGTKENSLKTYFVLLDKIVNEHSESAYDSLKAESREDCVRNFKLHYETGDFKSMGFNFKTFGL